MTDTARHAVQAIFLSAALMFFWLICVGDLNRNDIWLGVGATAVSVAFSLFVVRTLPLEFRPSFRDLIQIWRLPWYMAVDVTQVLLVLAADLAGRRAPSLFRSTPWHVVAKDGHEVAKRTLAIAYTTVSPNFVIIGIDVRRHQLFFHQLKKTEVPLMTQHLGAENPQ